MVRKFANANFHLCVDCHFNGWCIRQDKRDLHREPFISECEKYISVSEAKRIQQERGEA